MKTALQTLFLIFLTQTAFGQFITTWETTTNGQSITIPINKIPYNTAGDRYVYNYTVDWGDGSTSVNQTDEASHVFATAGKQTITITGTFPAICFKNTGDKNVIKTIEQWGNNPWKSMEKAFEGCANLTINAQDSPDLSNVTNMSRMFKGTYTFNNDISNWNVSNITNMSFMFHSAEKFNQDISGWDVSNVKDMGVMFSSAFAFNQDISSWNVSNVTIMRNMFAFTKNFNQNINDWDVSNVTNMSQMFSNAEAFNQDISGWDVSNVTDMSFMFLNRGAFNQDIGSWDVGKVTNMSYMFSLNLDMTDFFNQDISSWNVSNVTNMSNMFRNSGAFNQDISNWNVSKVTNMSNMLNNSGLSSNNYDKLLKGWAKQNLKTNVKLGAVGLNYCSAEVARNTLISSPNNWIIKGDSKNCNGITLISDANFEQYLIGANIDSDKTINGQVLTSDIENVTQLIIKDKNITDLTGIQDFKKLIELDATNNQITTINLSNNLKLEKLFVANNQLSTIDLSKNTNLKNLDVGENSLTELDVHLLLNLETFSCYKNQLSTINLFSNTKLLTFIANQNLLKTVDIRENKVLFWIDVEDNKLENLTVKNGNNSKLTTFKVTNNPNLTCIEVDDVSFSNTNWTDKDATANYSTDCAPANDDCDNAIPLTFDQETPGDVNSGNINNNPSCATGNVIADVWFSVIVPDSGKFSIQGSGFGGQLKFAVYSTCQSNVPIACGTSISLKDLTVGAKFYLKVWLESASKSSKNQADIGSFTITASETSVLSVEDFNKENENLEVYPNPATSNIIIAMSNNTTIKNIEIYNILGKKVITQKSNSNSKINVNVADLASGVYFIRANTNKKTLIKKIIIK
ncbi:BspA family leucine-rich repeat surface protein [Polaribacter uvawellassae]|uniref:BspA family leucine-rich repeat surface protein n=1 Tax=Polaribacter uvawellassae TaxID=3133495 RepID=UPI0032190FF2